MYAFSFREREREREGEREGGREGGRERQGRETYNIM